MSKISLWDICLNVTSSHLIECFWPVGLYYDSDPQKEFNPFTVLTHPVIEELILRVVRKVPPGSLNARHLHLLLTSGNVKNFTFDNVHIKAQNFVEVLQSLSVHANRLKTFILRDVYIPYNDLDQKMLCSAVSNVLTLSINLEHLETDKAFEFESLHFHDSLKHLQMNFLTKKKLHKLIPIVDGNYATIKTLTYFSLLETAYHRIPAKHIAILLLLYPEVVTFRTSISDALDLLHATELQLGTLTGRYKLQNFVLGRSRHILCDPSLTPTSVQIAAVVCPDAKKIEIVVSDHEPFPFFGGFKKLRSFTVFWENSYPGEYVLGLCIALRDIGTQLQELCICNFKSLNFIEIGKFCPSLKVLRVIYKGDAIVGTSTDALFTNLEILEIEHSDEADIDVDVVSLLLAGCQKLRTLYLDPVLCITDKVLSDILMKNRLTQLRKLGLVNCNLTQSGLLDILSNCTLLEFFEILTHRLTPSATKRFIHFVNSEITVELSTFD